MNFQKIKHLANDKDTIRHLVKHPTEIFKLYAQDCTIDEWLKIYYENPTCAVWMYPYTKFCYPIERNYINLAIWPLILIIKIIIND